MKIRYWLFCTIFYINIGFAQVASSPATQVVESLLNGMVNFESTNAELKAHFAPSFANANSIQSERFGVDVYRPNHFMISSVKGNIVTSYIWSKGFSWVHKLRFKTVKENGKTYIMPSGMRNGNIIKPWNSVETFIDIDKSTLVANTDFQPVSPVEPLESEDSANKEPVEIVIAMLSGMVNAEEISKAQLKMLLAPSFAKANSIQEERIGIEVFPPDYFMIWEVKGSMVTGLIWNERKSWVHQLIFNTVQENGQTYIMPSGIDAYNMIQPWHSVKKFMPIQRSKLVANTDTVFVPKLVVSEEEEVQEPSVKKLSDYIQFSGEMVGADPTDNTFSLLISKGNVVTLVVSMGTMAFDIYETERRNTGKMKEIVFKIERNNLTPGAFKWTEFIIKDVSQLSHEEKRVYTAGIVSDCKYVIDIKGEPKLRFMANLNIGTLE